MSFKYLPNTTLPSLAWIASVDLSNGECRVEHGSLVEVRDGFFVEGGWPAAFEEPSFDRHETFFVNGAIKYPDGAIAFVSSSATVDYLYHCRTAQVLLCSNSLPYLLAVRNDELIEFEPDYAHINDSIASGIDRYEQAIPTRRA